MERKNILTSQIVIVKNECKEDFCKSGTDTFGYFGGISAETYCAFISLDYSTVRRLGNVTYNISYLKDIQEGDKPFCLLCETLIDSVVNDKLSFILDDSEDWLGLFNTEGGKAQWLPSNWKELITAEQLHDILQERNIQTIECLNDDDVPDEMKERIAVDWCKKNSSELKDYLSDSDKELIAYDYMDENACTCASHCFEKMSSYEQKDFIKECIDNL